MRTLRWGILLAVCSLMLSGCWNYRSLDQLAIVTGIAIDKSEADDSYHLALEIVDLAADKEGKGKVKIIEAQGKTVFDAFRNANNRLSNKLYLGNMKIVLIGHQVLEKESIKSIIEVFLRDSEPRETVKLAVAQAKTAKEILSCDPVTNSVASDELWKIIEEDHGITDATSDIELYQAINTLHQRGRELVLPVFRIIENDGKETMEANGVALFKQEKIVGYLDALQTRYFLFANDTLETGTLMVDAGEGYNAMTFTIIKNKTRVFYHYDQGGLKILLRPYTQLFADEIQRDIDVFNQEEMDKLAWRIESFLAREITTTIQTVQQGAGVDVFGFGALVYQKDPLLWKQIGDDWPAIFQAAEIKVEPKVVVVNTGFVKQY